MSRCGKPGGGDGNGQERGGFVSHAPRQCPNLAVDPGHTFATASFATTCTPCFALDSTLSLLCATLYMPRDSYGTTGSTPMDDVSTRSIQSLGVTATHSGVDLKCNLTRSQSSLLLSLSQA